MMKFKITDCDLKTRGWFIDDLSREQQRWAPILIRNR